MKKIFPIILLAIVFFLSIFISIQIGATKISITNLFLDFKNGIDSSTETIVMMNIRLPRIILGILVGSGLAVSGVVVQGLFRNPLVEPGLIGVSTGSALASSLCIVFLGSMNANNYYILHLASFAGAMLASFLVFGFSLRSGRIQTFELLLTGIGINAIAGACIGFIVYFASDTQLRSITFWSLGSIAGANWNMIVKALPFLVLPYLFLPFFSRSLNVMQLGEREAAHLGFPVEAIKVGIILIICLIVGTCVSLSGIIGFVGLVVPHILRISISSDYRLLIPASSLMGAVLVLVADSLARTLVAPSELPIGIMTSAIGAPIFLWVLKTQIQKAGL